MKIPIYIVYIATQGCNIVSQAFLISKNTTAVGMLLLTSRATWSFSLMHYNVIL
jgi:hypothetical protein